MLLREGLPQASVGSMTLAVNIHLQHWGYPNTQLGCVLRVPPWLQDNLDRLGQILFVQTVSETCVPQSYNCGRESLQGFMVGLGQ